MIFLALGLLTFAHAQVAFTDVSEAAQLLPNTKTEGVAVGDYNNDGYDDIYACSPYGKNQLYRNNGDETFSEVGDSLGLALESDVNSAAAVWGDLDNDGWLDLYVTNKSVPDQLFHNNGDGTFTEISFEAGIYHLGNPKALNLADVNNDGFLDIYISNFKSENALYLNNGDLTFSNHTYLSRALDRGSAMGAIFFDYDKDGDVDLYLVHDSYEPNFLYQNDGNGVFTEVGEAAGVDTRSFGMGVDVGDVNHDGWLDIYIANLGVNFLLLNKGDGTFENISQSAGVTDPGMGWGTVFLDFDNDGWEDIYVGNFYQFSPSKNVLYRNQGNLSFEISEEDGPVSNVYATYGVASLDFNLDGQIDLLAANRAQGERIQLFKNPDRQNHWLAIKLVGTQSNRDGVGAKVELIDDLGTLHFQEQSAGLSWLSQNSHVLHFGLGQAAAIREARIIWPSGLEEEIELNQLDRFYTVTEGEGAKEGFTPAQDLPPIDEGQGLSLVPNPSKGDFLVQFFTETEARARIDIYDPRGSLLYQKELDASPGANRIPVELSGLNIDLSHRLIFVRLTLDKDRVETRSCLILRGN
jgi:hypothetical protein